MFDFVHKKRGSHFCEPLYCLCFDFFMFITSYHLSSLLLMQRYRFFLLCPMPKTYDLKRRCSCNIRGLLRAERPNSLSFCESARTS